MTIALSGLDLADIEWNHTPPKKAESKPDRRSELSCPNIVSDVMESTLNHADGQRYTSKSGFEKAVKASGCEIVGNDSSFKKPKHKEYEPQGVGEDIKRAIEEVSSR